MVRSVHVRTFFFIATVIIARNVSVVEETQNILINIFNISKAGIKRRITEAERDCGVRGGDN